MTEATAGMSPERQGWFAGLKEKVRRSFTVSGAKEKFYQKNADLIQKATENLTPEQKQQAFAEIEQDALSSAKVDVAMHWGAAVVGTSAVVLGFGVLSPRVQQVLREKGGNFGGKLADRGQRAHEWLRRVIRLPRWQGSAKASVIPDDALRYQELQELLKDKDRILKNAEKEHGLGGKAYNKIKEELERIPQEIGFAKERLKLQRLEELKAQLDNAEQKFGFDSRAASDLRERLHVMSHSGRSVAKQAELKARLGTKLTGKPLNAIR